MTYVKKGVSVHLVARGVDNPGGHLDSPGSMVETRDVLFGHGSSIGADEFDVDHVGRLLLRLWRKAVRCDGARLARILRKGPDEGARGGEYLGPLANNLQEMHMIMSHVLDLSKYLLFICPTVQCVLYEEYNLQ